MSGFNTKERNNNGEFEITFYTENQQDFKKVQDLCRKLIGHGKPVLNEGDLISRNDLKEDFKKRLSNAHKWLEKAKDEETKIRANAVITYICEVIMTIDNAPTVELNDKSLEIARKSIELGRSVGKLEGKHERPQGEWIDYDNTFYKCPDCGYLLEKCCPQCQNKVVLPKGGAE